MDQFNKPLLGNRIDPEHPLSKGLVGAWLFNEGSGNRIYDLSGNGNDGVTQNIDFVDGGWRPGRTGHAFLFDGLNDYIDCGSNRSLDVDTAITIGAWINKNTDDIHEAIVAKDKHYGNDSDCYSLRITDVNKFSLALRIGAGNPLLHSNATILVADEWTHVIGTYDNSFMKIYVNGQLDNENPQVGNLNVNNAIDLIIGDRSVKDGLRAFDGLIDVPYIWNRALSAQEVQDLYINPYGFIYQPNKYWLTTPLRSAVNKFTAEHIDTHFIAEPIETHFIAEAVETHFIAEPHL